MPARPALGPVLHLGPSLSLSLPRTMAIDTDAKSDLDCSRPSSPPEAVEAIKQHIEFAAPAPSGKKLNQISPLSLCKVTRSQSLPVSLDLVPMFLPSGGLDLTHLLPLVPPMIQNPLLVLSLVNSTCSGTLDYHLRPHKTLFVRLCFLLYYSLHGFDVVLISLIQFSIILPYSILSLF